LARRGNRGHPSGRQNIYRCAGEDNWIAVTIRTDAEWNAFVGLMGEHETDPVRWFDVQEAWSVVDRLADAGIPAAVVVSPSLVTENPQLLHRGFFERLTHPSTGAGLYPCPPFARLDGEDRWLRCTPPTLGQHNREVLTGLCGLTDDDLERLAAQGVIGTRPKGL
jgi:crotonobetainyl-CoA:carnitine CoA-transferase CaiB-like acyl-CoA transferase